MRNIELNFGADLAECFGHHCGGGHAIDVVVAIDKNRAMVVDAALDEVEACVQAGFVELVIEGTERIEKLLSSSDGGDIAVEEELGHEGGNSQPRGNFFT